MQRGIKWLPPRAASRMDERWGAIRQRVEAPPARLGGMPCCSCVYTQAGGFSQLWLS